MKPRRIIGLGFLLGLVLFTGCDLATTALSDVRGWNVSACWNGWQTCMNLFWDNRERIAGGEQTVTDLMSSVTPGSRDDATD